MNQRGTIETMVEGVELVTEVDTTNIARYLIRPPVSEILFKKFTSRKRLEHYLDEYLKCLKEVLRMSTDYDEETTLNDIFMEIIGEMENQNGVRMFFSQLQEEICRLVMAIDNTDLRVFLLQLTEHFYLFFEDEMERILSSTIDKIPAEKAEILLNCEKICSHACINDFLCRVLVEHEDEEIRAHSWEILRGRTNCLHEHLCTVILEGLCLQLDDEILDVCLEHVTEKWLLTFSCFKRMTKYFAGSILIIQKVLEFKLQRIPMYFVHEFKKYATVNQPGVIEIGKLLIEAKYCKINDINCIRELIRTSYSNALDLLNTAMKCGNDIPNDIIDEVCTHAPTTAEEANILTELRLVFGKESAIDILSNSRVDLTDRKIALEEIVEEPENHSPEVVKLLETLIKYEENLRCDCFNALTSILPENYTERGFSLNLHTVLSSISATTFNLSDAISTLIQKDRTCFENQNLLGILRLFFHAKGNLTLEDALPLLYELSNSRKSQRDVGAYLDILLEEARHVRDPNVRDEVCLTLTEMSNSATGKAQLPNNVLDIYTVRLTNNDINDDFLRRLELSVSYNYPVPKKALDLLIDSLEDIEFEIYYLRVAKILFLINLFQKLERKAEKIFDIMLRNQKLLENSLVADYIRDIIDNIEVPQQKQYKFQRIFLDKVRNCQMKQNLMKFATVVFKEREMNSTVLEEIAGISHDNAENLDNRTLAVKLLLQQMCIIKEHSRIPKDVIVALKKVALETSENISWNLSACAFQALARYDEAGDLPEVFLQTYYRNIKTQLLHLSAPEELNALDDFIAGREVADLSKFRVLKAIGNVVGYKLRINIYRLVSGFPKEEWAEMLLRSTLIASTLRDSCVGNKFLKHMMWNNMNVLKERVLVFYANQEKAETMFGNALQAMIDKQHEFQFDINQTCDILAMLSSSETALQLVFKQSNCFLIELRKTYLEDKLISCGIPFESTKAVEMSYYLEYGVLALEAVFSKIKKNTEFQELLKFLNMVEHSLSTKAEKIHFFVNEIIGQKDISNWMLQLDKVLIKKLLKSKVFRPNPDLEINVPDTNYTLDASGNPIVPPIRDISNWQELYMKLCKVRDLGWHMDAIEELIDFATNEQKRSALVHALDTIIAFKLREYDSRGADGNLLDVFRRPYIKNLQQKIQELMVSRIFPGTFTKPVKALVKEIHELNKHKQLSLLDEERLSEEYEKITRAYQKPSDLRDLRRDCRICNWDKDQIKLWACKFKDMSIAEKKSSISIYEKIAVAKRAVEVTSTPQIIPRDIQLLALLLLFSTKQGLGRLLQINTGEGKTQIIACFAAIKALEGHTVDIITSSSELAKPQADEQKSFFRAFGLTVNHIEERKETDCRYKSTILYGSANSFMADTLKNDYHNLDVRCEREYDIVIVDEVDSLLIDGCSHVVMLSTPLPALKNLEPILALIWVHMHNTAEKIIEEDGITYYNKPTCEINENGESNVVSLEKVPLECTKEEFLKRSTEEYMTELFKNTEEGGVALDEVSPKLGIPEHLRYLAKIQLSHWIDSAIRAAYKYELGKDYIIKDNQIVPVDAMNTGTLQVNMLLSDGCHQFLQFKHGARVSPESFCTNFISNVSYFKLYQANHLYGVTGTLGSLNAKELLEETYKVNSFILPPFQKKQYVELDPIITDSEKDWYRNILRSCLIHLMNGRAVLIITEYINNANEILKMFENSNYERGKIKMYLTAEDSDSIKIILDVGMLIISTNIAGRGTDIKLLKRVQSNGGLHLCLTFLPINQRVEVQNFGRTSRSGAPGSGQFVLLVGTERNFTHLKVIRNEEEKTALDRARTDMGNVIIKDKIFKQFCELLGTALLPVDPNDTHLYSVPRRAIEERFAIWLKSNEENIVQQKENDIWEAFQLFSEEILGDVGTVSLVKNPFLYIISGNTFLVNCEYEKAMNEYSEAIKIDKGFTVADAYYYKAYACICRYGHDVNENRDKMEEAISDLKKAQSIIENVHEPMTYLLSLASNNEVFTEQIRLKMKLLAVQKQCIVSAVGCNVDRIIEDLEAKKDGLSQKDIEILDEQISEYKNNRERYDRGIIRQSIDANRNILATIHDHQILLPEENGAAFDAEVAECHYNGNIGFFQVTEESSFRSIVMLIIGIAKVLAGICLILLSPRLVIGGFGLVIGGFGLVIGGFGLGAVGLCEIITSVGDLFFARNKVAWKSCGIFKFIIFEVFVGYYSARALVNTAASFFSNRAIASNRASNRAESKKKEKNNLAETGAKLWEISKKGKDMIKTLSQELHQDVDVTLDEISEANSMEFFLPHIANQIRDNIMPSIEKAIKGNEKIIRMLEHDERNKNNYHQNLILKSIDENFSGRDERWYKKFWEYLKANAPNRRQSTNTINVVKIVEAIHETCRSFPTEFNASVTKIANTIQIPTENNTQANRINQNLNSKASTSGTKNDINVSKVPREQVELSKLAEEFAVTLGNKLSEKMANQISPRLTAPAPSTNSDMVIFSRMTQKVEELRERESLSNNAKSNDTDPNVISKLINNVDMKTLEDNVRDNKMGRIHLELIAMYIARPIVVLNSEDQIMLLSGRSQSGEELKLQYHQDGDFEHWTLPGKKELKYRLLDLIADQVNTGRNRLKHGIIEVMRNNQEMVKMLFNSNQAQTSCFENILMDNSE